MRTLICICSKSPNQNLEICVNALYKIQIDDKNVYKICVVDSDSSDMTHYEKLKNKFPDIVICLVKNKNYEYGAWKYVQASYPNYDVYFCIQDTNIIRKKVELNVVDDLNAYTYFHDSGYNSHLSIKKEGIDIMMNSKLNCDHIVHTNFRLAQHNILIVNNTVMKDMFTTLQFPPVDKNGSCIYERIFGLYFISKNINTINLAKHIDKINGHRY
jgi:hypothetical protein